MCNFGNLWDATFLNGKGKKDSLMRDHQEVSYLILTFSLQKCTHYRRDASVFSNPRHIYMAAISSPRSSLFSLFNHRLQKYPIIMLCYHVIQRIFCIHSFYIWVTNSETFLSVVFGEKLKLFKNHIF